MNRLSQIMLLAPLCFIGSMAFALTLSQRQGDSSSPQSSSGYFRIKPLTGEAQKAMLDKVEKIKQIPVESFAAREFKASNMVSLPYRLLKPKDYKPGVKYPLVVVFHGSAAIGKDNMQHLGTLATADESCL